MAYRHCAWLLLLFWSLQSRSEISLLLCRAAWAPKRWTIDGNHTSVLIAQLLRMLWLTEYAWSCLVYLLTLRGSVALSKLLSGQAKWKDAVESGAYLGAMENRGSHTGLNGELKAFQRLSIASDSFAPCCTDERGGHMPWICHFSRCRQWFLDILSTIQAVQAVQSAHGSQSTHQPAQQMLYSCLLFMLRVHLESLVPW